MSLDGLIDVRRTAVSKKATISSISVNLGIDERCPNLVWMNVSKSSCSVVLASFGGYYIFDIWPRSFLSFLLSRTWITFKIGVFGHSYIANWWPLTSASNVEGGPTSGNNQFERVAHLLKTSACNIKERPTHGRSSFYRVLLLLLVWPYGLH